MNILIDDIHDWLNDKSGLEDLIHDVVRASLEEEAFPMNVEISLTLTDDEIIRQINCEHRGIDDVTDVISFPQIDWANDEFEKGHYKNFPGEDIILGDIVISTERLTKQAKSYHHSLERELGFLVAHSMFHLLGYDHISKEQELEMMEKQEAILGKLGLVR